MRAIIKNDDIRGRGTYRQVLHALKSLVKYEFNPILCITNYYKEDKNILLEEFKKICDKIGFETQEHNFVINNFYDKTAPSDIEDFDWESLDCEYGRILTAKGIYTCPFLSNDHRGRSGGDFTDFSDKTVLETPQCSNCINNKKLLFGINFSEFSE